jgi:hypothetical protein
MWGTPGSMRAVTGGTQRGTQRGVIWLTFLRTFLLRDKPRTSAH